MPPPFPGGRKGRDAGCVWGAWSWSGGRVVSGGRQVTNESTWDFPGRRDGGGAEAAEEPRRHRAHLEAAARQPTPCTFRFPSQRRDPTGRCGRGTGEHSADGLWRCRRRRICMCSAPMRACVSAVVSVCVSVIRVLTSHMRWRTIRFPLRGHRRSPFGKSRHCVPRSSPFGRSRSRSLAEQATAARPRAGIGRGGRSGGGDGTLKFEISTSSCCADFARFPDFDEIGNVGAQEGRECFSPQRRQGQTHKSAETAMSARLLALSLLRSAPLEREKCPSWLQALPSRSPLL